MDNIRNPCRGFVVFILIISIYIQGALAFPVLPSQFYGEIIIDAEYAPIGTNISAFDNDGSLCGSFALEKNGEYIISCKGDDPATSEDEGARENEYIIFRVNNKSTFYQAKWHQGGFSGLNLIIKIKNETEAGIEYPSKQRIPPNFYLLITLFLGLIIFLFIKLKKISQQ